MLSRILPIGKRLLLLDLVPHYSVRQFMPFVRCWVTVSVSRFLCTGMW